MSSEDVLVHCATRQVVSVLLFEHFPLPLSFDEIKDADKTSKEKLMMVCGASSETAEELAEQMRDASSIADLKAHSYSDAMREVTTLEPAMIPNLDLGPY